MHKIKQDEFTLFAYLRKINETNNTSDIAVLFDRWVKKKKTFAKLHSELPYVNSDRIFFIEVDKESKAVV